MKIRSDDEVVVVDHGAYQGNVKVLGESCRDEREQVVDESEP